MNQAVFKFVLIALAVPLIFSNVLQAQFRQTVDGLNGASGQLAFSADQGAMPTRVVPMWRFKKPANQFRRPVLGGERSFFPTSIRQTSSAYSQPSNRMRTMISNSYQPNSYQPNSVIPLRSARPVEYSYRSIPDSVRRPLTNVYRSPTGSPTRNLNSTYSARPAPTPAPSQVSLIDALDINQINQVSEGGTGLLFPATATREFIFQLDGTSYKINPGESVNLAADREYSLRFPAGPGLGDRIATLKQNEIYTFDFRGDEGWVLIPSKPASSATIVPATR